MTKLTGKELMKARELVAYNPDGFLGGYIRIDRGFTYHYYDVRTGDEISHKEAEARTEKSRFRSGKDTTDTKSEDSSIDALARAQYHVLDCHLASAKLWGVELKTVATNFEMIMIASNLGDEDTSGFSIPEDLERANSIATTEESKLALICGYERLKLVHREGYDKKRNLEAYSQRIREIKEELGLSEDIYHKKIEELKQRYPSVVK